MKKYKQIHTMDTVEKGKTRSDLTANGSRKIIVNTVRSNKGGES